MTIIDFFENCPEKMDELENIFQNVDFEKFIFKVRNSQNVYFFHIKTQNGIIARSKGFSEKSERDELLVNLIKTINEQYHKNRQLCFSFVD